MIKYSVSDLIKAATQIADLENSDFISWNENIRLINEAYVSLYQKLIDKGESAFTVSVSLKGNTFELPNDFWQLKSIVINNNGNIFPITRRAASESYNSINYEIKNNILTIGGNYSGTVVIEYYKTPVSLYYKPENVSIELTSDPQAASDKLYLLADGAVYNFEKETIIHDPDTDFVGNAPYIMTDSYIVNKNGVALNLVKDIKDEEGVKVVINNKVYNYDADTKEIKKGNIAITTLEDYPFETDVKIVICDDTFTDLWGITTDGKLYHGTTEIENITVSDCKYNNGNLWVHDSNIGIVEIVDDEVVIIEMDNEPLCINKIDYTTGYGITTFRSGYFVESFLQDTFLNFPNTFYFQILSYILAISYKIKQNADASQIIQKCNQLETTFYDSLTNDVFSSYRITNVY